MFDATFNLHGHTWSNFRNVWKLKDGTIVNSLEVAIYATGLGLGLGFGLGLG